MKGYVLFSLLLSIGVSTVTANWTHIQITSQNDGKFGLAFGDFDHDGDVDGDALSDILCGKCGQLYWLEATDAAATAWQSRLVGTSLPVCDDHDALAQGYTLGQISPGGKPELIFSSRNPAGTGVFGFSIPDNPEAGS